MESLTKRFYIYSLESFEEKYAFGCMYIRCVTSFTFKREYRIIPILSWVVKL